MKVEITQSNLRMSKKSLDIRSDMKKIHVTSVCGFKRIKIYSIKSDLHGTATCFKMLFQATLVRFQLSQAGCTQRMVCFFDFFCLSLSRDLETQVGETDANVNVVISTQTSQKGDGGLVLVVRHSQVRVHLL